MPLAEAVVAGRTDSWHWINSMLVSFSRPVRRTVCHAALLLTALATSLPSTSAAIEMFTYFGDGSRVGLPNLEVPIEAYPGIPLRSDRLRARRRAMQAGPGTGVRLGPPGLPTQPGGIVIRAMPQTPATLPPATLPPAALPPPVPRAP